MSVPWPSELALRIERADSSRIDDETVAVSLSGRWTGSAHEAAGDELLVVEVSGRRYRYPARSQSAESPAALAGPRSWTARFELPAWAEPRSAGQASLWIGSSVIEVPPVGSELVEHEGVRRAELERARDAERATASQQLEDYERSASELTQLVSERDAALAQLGSERDAALAELAMLRASAQHDVKAREQLGRRGGELGQARALLADARALATRLRERGPNPR
jgi:hypothetical protein